MLSRAAELSLSKLRNFNASIPFFYRIETLIAIVAGVLLAFAPAAIVESPEPTYTAETLMRRCSGVNAALLLGTANYLLLSAAQRDRLGAGTFRALNGTACLQTVAVRVARACWGLCLPRVHMHLVHVWGSCRHLSAANRQWSVYQRLLSRPESCWNRSMPCVWNSSRTCPDHTKRC